MPRIAICMSSIVAAFSLNSTNKPADLRPDSGAAPKRQNPGGRAQRNVFERDAVNSPQNASWFVEIVGGRRSLRRFA